MQITVDGVTKRYGDFPALDDVTIEFPDRSLTAVLGPSGCGKSTLLNVISGILSPTSGRVLFDGRDVTRLPPERRGLGFVFQSYALYPHFTVAENIGFPLRFTRGGDRRRRRERVHELADLVRVNDLLDHRPGELSGGQQQRVAIARALAKQPGLVLLDEPLSNLDARLRVEMRTEIRRIQEETGVTMILVTHDQEDALSVSDAVLLIRAGNVEQLSTPTEVYRDPHSLFVADFIGSPPINQFPVTVHDAQVRATATGRLLHVTTPTQPGGDDGQYILAVRAEAVQLDPRGRGAVVISRLSSGRENLYTLQLAPDLTLQAYAGGDVLCDTGDEVGFSLDRHNIHYFHPDSGARLS